MAKSSEPDELERNSHAEPVYEVRIQQGMIEVRLIESAVTEQAAQVIGEGV